MNTDTHGREKRERAPPSTSFELNGVRFFALSSEAINFHYHIRLSRLGSECDRIHREGGRRRPSSGRGAIAFRYPSCA